MFRRTSFTSPRPLVVLWLFARRCIFNRTSDGGGGAGGTPTVLGGRRGVRSRCRAAVSARFMPPPAFLHPPPAPLFMLACMHVYFVLAVLAVTACLVFGILPYRRAPSR